MHEKCEMLVKILNEKKKKIATMESCTGGGVANQITNISGASDVLEFSAVTYSSSYKVKMGVKKETIDKYTVYSSNVAREMSKSISEFANSDYGIGVTGKLDVIDEEEERLLNNKIYVSVYDRENDKYIESVVTGIYRERSKNKEIIIEEILDMVLNIL